MDNVHLPVVTEEEVLQELTFLECVVLSPSLYILIPVFYSILVNCDVLEYTATITSILINLYQKEYGDEEEQQLVDTTRSYNSIEQ